MKTKMTCTIYYVLFYSLFAVECSIFPYVYPRLKFKPKEHNKHNAGDPLILTPYLKKGSIHLAQNLSRVPLTDMLGFPSHAGYFTVDEDYNSNMYFWYFPPLSQNAKAPVLVWLQGGPGASSLFGLFAEMGPIAPKKGGFGLRKYHWALDNHLIFIDNPVGTGFSFTKDSQGYCNNEDCIAKNLYTFMQQFFILFPKLRKNDFFITGESYAGKYIPSLAMEIHRQNSNGREDRINLKGLAIGNGYCDPIHQMDYGSYLYQQGLLDNSQLEIFEDLQRKIVLEIENQNWVAAGLLVDKMLDGEIGNFSYFKNFTGFTYYYNILIATDDTDMSIFTDLLNNDKVRRSVHVGNIEFNAGDDVRLHLAFDILKSVAPYISELLSHYRIMFYNGQLDIIVAYPLTVNFLRELNFDAAFTYKNAPRSIWTVDNEIAGYVKTAGNLTEVLVRNAGHLVPQDQPKWALDLITRFLHDKS